MFVWSLKELVEKREIVYIIREQKAALYWLHDSYSYKNVYDPLVSMLHAYNINFQVIIILRAS